MCDVEGAEFLARRLLCSGRNNRWEPTAMLAIDLERKLLELDRMLNDPDVAFRPLDIWDLAASVKAATPSCPPSWAMGAGTEPRAMSLAA